MGFNYCQKVGDNMYQFFVKENQVDDGKVYIKDDDFKHMKNAIRLRPGEKIRVSVEHGDNYICHLTEYTNQEAVVEVEEKAKGTELDGTITLLQGLPKSDKMDFIIQKAVELGVATVIPVIMQNSVVKLEPKKENHKLERWNAIAYAAAKQAKRSVVPKVLSVMSFDQALSYMDQNCDKKLVPYENARGIDGSREIIASIGPDSRVGILIGPEGGFSDQEIEKALMNMDQISLGRRILRTETAAISMITLIMYQMERD